MFFALSVLVKKCFYSCLLYATHTYNYGGTFGVSFYIYTSRVQPTTQMHQKLLRGSLAVVVDAPARDAPVASEDRERVPGAPEAYFHKLWASRSLSNNIAAFRELIAIKVPATDSPKPYFKKVDQLLQKPGYQT